MDLETKYRIRVQSCVGAICDVHETIQEQFGRQEFLGKFEELKTGIENLDMNLVCEGDVLMVEKATNDFLSEFREVFRAGKVGPVYEKLAS